MAPSTRGKGVSKQLDPIQIKGKCSPYGFFVRVCYEEHKKRFPDEVINVCEISKLCARKWPGIDESTKARFYALARKDADRYDSELAAYAQSLNAAKKIKKRKNPDAPKRPLTAFFCFANAKRPELRARFPEASLAMIAKQLGEYWKNMSAVEKAPYARESEALRAKYYEAMAVYRGQKNAEKQEPAGEEEQHGDFYPFSAQQTPEKQEPVCEEEHHGDFYPFGAKQAVEKQEPACEEDHQGDFYPFGPQQSVEKLEPKREPEESSDDYQDYVIPASGIMQDFPINYLMDPSENPFQKNS